MLRLKCLLTSACSLHACSPRTAGLQLRPARPPAAAQVFLGTLREPEIERVNERISQAVMETCLAMTIFREEFNTAFVAMFALLTFIKVFHWLVQDRVEYVESTPSVSPWQHLRIVAFMAWLLVSAFWGQPLEVSCPELCPTCASC